MKKLLCFLCLFLMPFCFVDAEGLELNKLSVEGNEIELKDDIYEYELIIDTDFSMVSVYVEVDDGVSYTVSGNNDISIGDNIITIDVTDGITSVQYKVNAKMLDEDIIKLSNNNRLKNLSVIGYPLGFDSDKLEYNLTIGAEAKLRISYTTENEEAEVYVEGNEGLVDGSVIKIKVVAQSGDVREYKINIKATEVREEIEVYEEEKYDLQFIAYIVAALLISIFLFIINITGRKNEK